MSKKKMMAIQKFTGSRVTARIIQVSSLIVLFSLTACAIKNEAIEERSGFYELKIAVPISMKSSPVIPGDQTSYNKERSETVYIVNGTSSLINFCNTKVPGGLAIALTFSQIQKCGGAKSIVSKINNIYHKNVSKIENNKNIWIVRE